MVLRPAKHTMHDDLLSDEMAVAALRTAAAGRVVHESRVHHVGKVADVGVGRSDLDHIRGETSAERRRMPVTVCDRMNLAEERCVRRLWAAGQAQWNKRRSHLDWCGRF